MRDADGCAERPGYVDAEHAILTPADRVTGSIGLDQAAAEALVRLVWEAGVAAGIRRMAVDLAAAHREIAEPRAEAGFD
ncbi:hypothetical protein OG948_02705 [Embleya sp. NBC_00888]|uniref:hypothetical protein n=1 Tax=Embleya sp. NBC_00888 TaxID=2975960 RepID=UPI003869D120|nr:hypothetical protein OG948_02705 [Embleya sp. NBC_00888]